MLLDGALDAADLWGFFLGSDQCLLVLIRHKNEPVHPKMANNRLTATLVDIGEIRTQDVHT